MDKRFDFFVRAIENGIFLTTCCVQSIEIAHFWNTSFL